MACPQGRNGRQSGVVNAKEKWLRNLTGRRRTQVTNLRLGLMLAFVAGAVNAGGFMIVGRYTSHITGILSSVADDMALANYQVVLAGLAYLLMFLGGAICSTQSVLWARRHRLQSEYALPLGIEGVLLLAFCMVGANLNLWLTVTVPVTVALLCFSMGFQNALITKISKAEIRTTHMTGIMTDLGIEIGRLMCGPTTHASPNGQHVKADLNKLSIHARMLLAFTGGGLVGAFGYQTFGVVITLLFASTLLIVAMPNLVRDLRLMLRKHQKFHF